MKTFEQFINEAGLAAGRSVKDIADKHKVDVSVIEGELQKGIKVEHEHTQNNDRARQIAMDHLFENPHYYTKLKKIE